MDSQVVLMVVIIVFFVFQFLFSSVVVDSKSITLSLSRHKHSSSSSKREVLHRLARSSSARAQSFKQSKYTSTPDLPSAVDKHNIPLFPLVGIYTLDLSFGTPLQTLPFVMDTGSSLVWFPCTAHFKCKDCNFNGTIRPFIPEESSSSRNVYCNSTQCSWFFPDHKCSREFSQESYCSGYGLKYGTGETAGTLLSEFLTFPEDESRLDNFIVGCSLFASSMSSGIAGFGRGNESLPSQMELDSFSYCMVSHDYDNKTMSSDLVLTTKGGNDSAPPTAWGTVQYTPLIDNPIYEHFYYVMLQKITVGNVNITVPDKYQIPDDVDGSGGTIVDSGTTYTIMEASVLNLVTKEFESQVTGKNNSRNSRNTTAEDEAGLGLCFDVWSFDDIPTLSLHFDGGAVMDLPMQNYFLGVEYSVVCLMMMTTQSAGIEGVGPAIILGNYVQQNFYVEFDLKYNRLGLLRHICTSK